MPQPNSVVVWPAGRWPTTRSTGQAKRGSVGRAKPGRTAAGRRRRRQPAGPRRARPAGGQARTAGTVRGLDADHRHGAHRRGRIPVDPGPRRPGDHPRRLQGDARRCARRAGEPSRRAGRGRGRAGPTSAWAKHRSPWWSCATAASADADELVEFLRTRLARYEIPTEIAIVDAIPRTPSGKADLGAVRSTSAVDVLSRSRPSPSVLRRQAPPRGTSAAGVRRRTPQLRGGRAPVGAIGARADRARRRQGHPRRRAVPERGGLGRRDAGRSADRCRSRAVLDVLHHAAKCAPSSLTADVAILLRHCVLSRHMTTASRLADIDRVASPARCATSLDRVRTGRRPSTPHCWRRWRTTSTARIPWRSCTRQVPRAPRRGWCTPMRPCSNTSDAQRDPRTDRRGQAVLQFALLLDRRDRVLDAGRPARRCTLVCSNATDAAETLDLLEAERPTMTNGFVAGIAHLARHPSLPRRDLSSMRRGNLYPIMAPEARPADPELRHTMLGMTETGSVVTDQRGRVRPTRTPTRIVRQAGTRIRHQGRRSRHRRNRRKRHSRRALYPRAVPHAAVLQAQP